MGLTLLIDFGSTYTKVTAVDLVKEEIVGAAKAPTSVETDVMIGLNQALGNLKTILNVPEAVFDKKIASSSAAGGLKMIAVGLVPELTVEAAKMAALSAGARLAGVYAFEMTEQEVEELIASKPDVILLAGGTDGGNRDVILHNARLLAESELRVPVVMAGNKAAQKEISRLFSSAGKDLTVTENVLPAVNKLNIEPARQAIREIFIKRIIQAKGIDKAMTYLDNILMPTPTAVLQAAQLLADGYKKEAGIGELIIVDVGGATTDVHSICTGKPTTSNVVVKGLPEPYAKRTVEGDLGVRYNALSIVEEAGLERLSEMSGLSPREVSEKARHWSEHTEIVPAEPGEVALDKAMAFCAVELAVARHAGTVESYYTPMGVTFVQNGKDLSEIRAVIGTGGPLVNSAFPHEVLQGALANPADPNILKPKDPSFFVDDKYILYAAGLLAESHPEIALRIMKKSLRQLSI